MDDLGCRFRRGDREALHHLAEAVTPRMLRLAMIFTQSESRAEELILRVWSKVVRDRRRFSGSGSPAAWIMDIARRLFAEEAPKLSLSVPAPAKGDSAHHGLAWVLYAEFHRLSPREQQAVGLRFIVGMSTERAAEAMDITETSFQAYLASGMAVLRDVALERGVA